MPWAPLGSPGLPWAPLGPWFHGPPRLSAPWILGRVSGTLVWVLWTLGLPGPAAAWTLGCVPWAVLGSPFLGSPYMSERVCILRRILGHCSSADTALHTSFQSGYEKDRRIFCSGAFVVLSTSCQYSIYCLYTHHTLKPYVAGTQKGKSASIAALYPATLLGSNVFSRVTPASKHSYSDSESESLASNAAARSRWPS